MTKQLNVTQSLKSDYNVACTVNTIKRPNKNKLPNLWRNQIKCRFRLGQWACEADEKNISLPLWPVTNKLIIILINTKWTFTLWNKKLYRWRGNCADPQYPTTPRHSSLAEIKTATTRNLSRLDGQWNRATGDNVSTRHSNRAPRRANKPRKKSHYRQVNINWTCRYWTIVSLHRALWNYSWSFNEQTFIRKRKFHRSRSQIAA